MTEILESRIIESGRKLRVAIECRIDDPRQGVGTAILGLASALSSSGITDQEYTFIVFDDLKDWLAPYTFGPCRLLGVPRKTTPAWKRALRAVTPLRWIWRRLQPRLISVPVSDGCIESHGFDVVHFATQSAYATALPSIYQPHDLQHLHYPEFFPRLEFAVREKLYRAFCDQARYVCVQTDWSKRDIVAQYGLPPDKVAVISWACTLDAYEHPTESTLRAAVEKFGLPPCFFFYPAVTWPHKNHQAIIRALQVLRSQYGRTVHVYFSGNSFSGTPSDHRKTLDALAQQLGVDQQVHFLGFVSASELQSLFATATAMIFPSKFEGFGLPVLEAFRAHLPVLCANATVLPEIAAEAALYFDPDSPADLAKLMQLILEDPERRNELIRAGNQVLGRYSREVMAAKFHALYWRTFGIAENHTAFVSGSRISHSGETGMVNQ